MFEHNPTNLAEAKDPPVVHDFIVPEPVITSPSINERRGSTTSPMFSLNCASALSNASPSRRLTVQSYADARPITTTEFDMLLAEVSSAR